MKGGVDMDLADRLRSRMPDGTLIRGLHSAIYLVEHGKKRPIIDMHTFHSYGLNVDSIINMEESILEKMDTGTPVNIRGDFIKNSPSTLLVKSNGSEVYLWSDQRLHPVMSSYVFLRFGFQYSSVVTLAADLITTLPVGEMIHESVLLTPYLINGRVYSAPNGLIYYSERQKLRKIGGPAVFAFYRWKIQRIIYLTKEEFNKNRLGEAVL